jgi:hypothetical protein
MGTATQMVWSATSGLLLVPREAQNTVKPFSPSHTTGGDISYPAPRSPMLTVSGEEQEWASLLASERKKLARKRIKPIAVNKAIRKLRYGR